MTKSTNKYFALVVGERNRQWRKKFWLVAEHQPKEKI